MRTIDRDFKRRAEDGHIECGDGAGWAVAMFASGAMWVVIYFVFL